MLVTGQAFLRRSWVEANRGKVYSPKGLRRNSRLDSIEVSGVLLVKML